MTDKPETDDGLSQSEIKEMVDVRKSLAGVVSLYIVRHRSSAVAALFVADSAEGALRFAPDLGLEGWCLANTLTQRIQKNVEMSPGALMVIPYSTGATTAYHITSRSAKAGRRRKKARAANRVAAQEPGGNDV